jgi:hypothetical protein
MFAAIGRFGAILIGWSYIPGILSTQLLVYFHRFYQSVLHRQPPAPGTPEYQKHQKWAYTVVVFGYALYTFWEAASSIKPNYYELLGVYPTADESDLKAGFRNFAKRYHPDRAGPESELYFMHVRTAYEALKNPTTRFAYDRYVLRVVCEYCCSTSPIDSAKMRSNGIKAPLESIFSMECGQPPSTLWVVFVYLSLGIKSSLADLHT